jgi:peptide/nickel transport system ATP-binding protein
VLGGERVSTPVIEAVSLARTYHAPGGAIGGVHRADLTVAAGEIVGIKGPSGAGKTTLLRLLAGVERPDCGELCYEGQAAWSGRRWPRRQMATYPRPGYVMPVYQDPFASLDPRWPIWRTITEPLGPITDGTLSVDERRKTARRALEKAGMASTDETSRPGELSGGQCQRVAILRALSAGPALLLADEPTARQDVITAAAMTDLLRIAAHDGTAMIVVSHNQHWLAGVAHRVLNLSDGQLSQADLMPGRTAQTEPS